MYPASSLDPLGAIRPAPAATLERMDMLDRARLRAAAFRATRIYPGPVGDLVCKEIMCFEEFGYRLDSGRMTMKLVAHIEKALLPTPATPAA